MARSFNGSSDYGSLTLNLAGVQQLTAAFWLYLNSWSTNDNVGMEHSANYNSNAGFIVDLTALASGQLAIGISDSGAHYSTRSCTPPSAAGWHHLAFTADRTLGTHQLAAIYVDGVSQSLTDQSQTMGAGTTFSNQTLYLMCRGGSSLFASGRLAELAFWSGALLTADEITGLARGRAPWRVRPGSLAGYWPLFGLQAPEPDLSGRANNVTLNGTTQANHAPVTLFTAKARTPCDQAVIIIVSSNPVRVFNLAAARANTFDLAGGINTTFNLGAAT
jgi:Concanavalin A-like lectin/glucanases superfamily